jgi:Alginate export
MSRSSHIRFQIPRFGKRLKTAGAAALTVIVACTGASAADPTETENGATIWLDERYRYEFVDQANRPQDAHAKTLRSRVGVLTPRFLFTRIGLEYEGVVEVGNDSFNNTINGKSSRPVVADVESHEINQAYVEFSGIPDTTVLGGRYRINLYNQRFIGSVGWRQNDQTFDGATVTNTSLPDAKLFYAYIGNVNRIFSDRSPVGDLEANTHLAHVTYTGLAVGTLKAYDYLLEFSDSAALSSNTFGVSLKGIQPIAQGASFGYYLEYAHQTDAGNNPTEFSADYYHLAPSIGAHGVTLTAGYEVLGSDAGRVAFATPLATLHIYNGFADVFLATPQAGIEDKYLDVTYRAKELTGPLSFLNGLLLKAQYHDFGSEVGSLDYGTEFDAYAKMPIGKGFYVEAKYANYQAEQFSVDTEKVILGIGYKATFSTDDLLRAR